MKNWIIIIITLFLSANAIAQKLVEAGKGYSSTSVNTTVFRNNSVVTFKKNQYISFYDADGFLVVGKRKLGTENWTLKKSKYRGNVKDAHNVISMMVDGNGYLHLSFDHHGNKLNYCRSIAPESLDLGEKESMVGDNENDVTYPEFYTLKGGDLLFAYRSGASGRGNLVLNRYDLKNRKWERVQDVLIDGENKRNAYWQLYVDIKGTIHLSWVWRETWLVETNHDLCYAKSPDGGKSWFNSKGERYTLPIRLDNAEYACKIPQNSELINQTSMGTDNDGNPYIATYWRDQNDSIPQYRLIWNDGNKWSSVKVGNRTTPFSLKGGGTKMIPISRPRMVVNKGKVYYIFRDSERGSKVSMAYTSDINKDKWSIIDLTDFPVNAWEPSYDSELWKKSHKLHVFVQSTNQGDGEKAVQSAPTSVYILEMNKINQINKY